MSIPIAAAELPADIRKELPDGACLVQTPHLKQVVANALRASKRGLITAVEGAAGSGKSLAVATAQVALARQVETYRLPIGQKKSSRDTISAFHQAISGDATPPIGTQTTLERELEEMLAGRRCLVLVDEAQKAGIDALEAMRAMHGHKDAVWGLLLAGAGLERVLKAQHMQMLWSRTRRGRILGFAHMTGKEVETYLPQFHPVWQHTPTWLLRRIDRVYCAGDWRDWAGITDEITDLWEPGSPVTEQLAYDAVQVKNAGKRVAGWDDDTDGRFDEEAP